MIDNKIVEHSIVHQSKVSETWYSEVGKRGRKQLNFICYTNHRPAEIEVRVKLHGQERVSRFFKKEDYKDACQLYNSINV